MTYANDVLIATSERICDQIEAFMADPDNQALPWQCPWNPNGQNPFPHNPTTGKDYRGLNAMILWMSGYGDSRWMGYNQAKEHLGYTRSGKGRFAKWNWRGEGEDPGFGVRKGEKGTRIFRPRMVRDENALDGFRCVGFAVTTVFNAQQIEGFSAPAEVEDIDPSIGHERAAEVLNAWTVQVNHGGNRAFYAPGADVIGMPEPGQFKTVSNYWATLGHEVIHSTGHPSRLDRLKLHSYAEEELVAEIGSAFLCAALGIERPSITEGHMRYLSGWLRQIKGDEKAIRKAASMAMRAADMVLKGE